MEPFSWRASIMTQMLLICVATVLLRWGRWKGANTSDNGTSSIYALLSKAFDGGAQRCHLEAARLTAAGWCGRSSSCGSPSGFLRYPEVLCEVRLRVASLKRDLWPLGGCFLSTLILPRRCFILPAQTAVFPPAPLFSLGLTRLQKGFVNSCWFLLFSWWFGDALINCAASVSLSDHKQITFLSYFNY